MEFVLLIIIIGTLGGIIGGYRASTNYNSVNINEASKRMTRREKKEQRRKTKENRERLEIESKDAEMISQIRKIAISTFKPYCRDKDEMDWVVSNKIDYVLSHMLHQKLEETIHEYDRDGKIDNLGPYPLNEKQMRIWHQDYLYAQQELKFHQAQAELKKQEEIRTQRKIQAEKERIARREKEEREKDWSSYKSKFKKLNKAQQKSELEWFSKKLSGKYTNSPEEREAYVHELEIILLGNTGTEQ